MTTRKPDVVDLAIALVETNEKVRGKTSCADQRRLLLVTSWLRRNMLHNRA